jgi:uracil DNA glycosylase
MAQTTFCAVLMVYEKYTCIVYILWGTERGNQDHAIRRVDSKRTRATDHPSPRDAISPNGARENEWHNGDVNLDTSAPHIA